MTPEEQEREERRGMDRRVYELERRVEKLMLDSAVTGTKVDGLVTTIDSRFKAFDRGIDLLLERMKPLDSLDAHISQRAEAIERHASERQGSINGRLEALEAIKNKAAGAMVALQVLSITGVIAGVLGIFKLLRTP